jgi:hypothetical protein
MYLGNTVEELTQGVLHIPALTEVVEQSLLS